MAEEDVNLNNDAGFYMLLLIFDAKCCLSHYYYLLFLGRTVCKLGLLQRRCSNQKGYEREIWL